MVKAQIKRSDLIKINEYTYEIAAEYRSDMRVPARFFATEALLEDMLQDAAPWQLVNVATLPGIVGYAYAMPDMHQGYGFPIGGVAAFDAANGGVISPGGIGYDINCGVRLLCSGLTRGEIKTKLEDLATALFGIIPSGMGRGGRLKLQGAELDAVLAGGAQQMVALGYGNQDDIEHCEENGKFSVCTAGTYFTSKQKNVVPISLARSARATILWNSSMLMKFMMLPLHRHTASAKGL